MGLNRSVLTSGTLSSLLQNGSRSVPTISSQSLKTNAGIKGDTFYCILMRCLKLYDTFSFGKPNVES